MEFRIANTFTDSLTKLTGDEQKAVKTTTFDSQLEIPAVVVMACDDEIIPLQKRK